MALAPIYDPEAVAPMWQELAAVGVEPLTTRCAAGQARPGAMLALQNAVIPDRSVTVFAGVDRDAVNRAREHMGEYPPSSPAMGLFKDGKLVFMLQRHDLQQVDEDQVSQALRKAFDQHCANKGPSIDAEK